MFTHELDWQPPESIPFSKLREVCALLGIPNGLRVTSVEVGTREVKITRQATNTLGQRIVANGHLAHIVTTVPVRQCRPVSLVKAAA